MDITEIQTLLGAPYYAHSACLIYHGDCLDYLRRLPSGIVDLTLTSPPYNIG